MTLEDLIKNVKLYDDARINDVIKAYEYASEHHLGQYRQKWGNLT